MIRSVALVLGATLLVFLLWRLGPTEILTALDRIGWSAVPIVLVYAAHHVTRAFALRSSVLRPNVLAFRDALAIRLSGEAVQSLTVTGPVLAEPTRAWLLQRHGLTLTEAFAATITEYLISSFVNAGMAIAALAYLIHHFKPSGEVLGIAVGIICVLIAFLVVAAIAIARRFYLIGTVIAGLARIGVLRGRWQPDMKSINRVEDVLLALMHDRPKRLVTLMVIEAGAQILLVLELLWLLHTLDLTVPQSYALIIEGSIKMIGVVFLFIPLQLGVAEGAYALIFDTMGLPSALGFAVAFLRRIRTVAVAGIGFATLVLSTRDSPQPR